MRITGGLVYEVHQGFVQRYLCVDGRLITQNCGEGEVYDAAGCYVIPGLTDLHFHGAKGHDFSDGDPAGLEEMARYELSRGVTQICPAGMTLLEDQLIKICKNLIEAVADFRKTNGSLFGKREESKIEDIVGTVGNVNISG